MAVRSESVRLSLVDDFSTGMARAAAATALLNRELNSLSGQSVKTARVSQNINRDTDALAKSANKADSSINQLTGRLRLFADVAAILGPALIPIGAVGLPAIAGLANQFGAAALAGGAAIIAFQGVGDALKAVNEAAIEPTAANLLKAEEAMNQLSPAAQEMVSRLQELRPVMQALRDASAEGLFPGLLEAFDRLETRAPDVQRILSSVSQSLGEVVAAGADGLASSRWDEFFNFLATEVPATLTDLGAIVGDLTGGMAELWMAFAPLNTDFNGWLRDVAAGFESWAAGLSQTDGFRDFIDYVRTNGPQVAETFAALADAVLQIVQAAAPLGGPVLAALEAVARVMSSIADSDLGTPIFTAVAAFAALSRAAKIYQGVAATAFGSRVTNSARAWGDSLLHVTTAQERATRSAGQLESAQTGMLSGMSRLDKAAIGVAGIIALDAAIDGLLGKMRDAVPGTEELTGRLLELGDAQTSSLGDQFRNLGEDLDFLNSRASAGSDMLGWLPNIQGLVPGWENAGEQFDRVTEQLEALDLAFANLASSGGAERAKQAFQDLADAQGLTGDQQEELLRQLPTYREALQSAANQAKLAGEGAQDGADGVGAMGDAAGDAEGNIRSFSTALAELSGFFDKRSAIRNYQAALDDFRKGLRETGRSFDVTSQKGRENQARLDDIATSALQVAENLQGIRRTQFVDSVVAQLRTMAGNLNGPAKKAVLDVIAQLKELGRQKPRPDVKVENGPAISSINAVEQRLRDLDGDVARTLVINEVRTVDTRVTVNGSRSTAGGITKNAASGGYISGPGGPRDDLIPARLSNGEYVIQAAAVARYGRAMFDRLNAMQFANGGYVGRQITNQSTSSSTVYGSTFAPVFRIDSITTTDAHALARALERRQRDAYAVARLP